MIQINDILKPIRKIANELKDRILDLHKKLFVGLQKN